MARLIKSFKNSWIQALTSDTGPYTFERGMVIRARKH